MHKENRHIRKLIEVARRSFHAVGVDVHRFRENDAVKIDRTDIFNAFTALRDEANGTQVSDEELSFLMFCANNLAGSHAQLFQDLFVLYQCQSKYEGFFVEFGATDGVAINNTVLLERQYEWRGILAEPARYWHQNLYSNRTSLISTDCVWRSTGETLSFNETESKELSTIGDVFPQDGHHAHRINGERYDVRTISLFDLLKQFNAPQTIDYLSVDTEGSEFDILSAFDFGSYDVRLITVEHNYTSNRERLHQLLVKNGYVRKFEALSQWDDWYVRQ